MRAGRFRDRDLLGVVGDESGFFLRDLRDEDFRGKYEGSNGGSVLNGVDCHLSCSVQMLAMVREVLMRWKEQIIILKKSCQMMFLFLRLLRYGVAVVKRKKHTAHKKQEFLESEQHV